MLSRTAAAGDITFSASNNAVKLIDAGGTDNEIGMVLPAKSVIPGQKYDVSFAYKADSAASAGFYARINADTSVLSSGNTAVASGGFHETGVKDVSNNKDTVPGFLNGSVLSNTTGGFPVSTSWQVKTFVYTVPTSAVVASLQFLKWSGISATNALYIKDVEFALQGAAGTDGITVILSNETHTFPASNGGNVAASAYAGGNTLISVYDGITQLDYDGSGSTAGHFTVSASATGITFPSSIADSGNNASITGFSGFTDALSTATVTYTITGKRVNGTALPSIVKVQTFSKANAGAAGTGTDGHRGLSSFVFEESTSNFNLNNTAHSQAAHATKFAAAGFEDTAYSGVAKNIAALILAHPDSDGEIRPGDRITITDNSANVAATRLWDGSVATSPDNVADANFSSLVVETFPGSVIVDGTLSAAKIQANSVTATNFNVGSNIVVGTATSAGAIYSSGKTSADNTTNGFYLGWSANNTPVFAIGGGGTGVAGTTLNNNGITVRDTGGTIRVKIGDLDLL
jgi:hypothetical protein